MRILISETPTKLFEVVRCAVIDDPEMVFLLTTPPGTRLEITEDNNAHSVDVAKLDVPPDGIRSTDSGYLYIEASARYLRMWDNSRVIYLRLASVADPNIIIDVEIFPRQIGYGIDDEWLDPDLVVAWLLAMPSPTEPRELDICTDIVRSDFMLVMPG